VQDELNDLPDSTTHTRDGKSPTHSFRLIQQVNDPAAKKDRR
jgi:hypothetical protein